MRDAAMSNLYNPAHGRKTTMLEMYEGTVYTEYGMEPAFRQGDGLHPQKRWGCTTKCIQQTYTHLRHRTATIYSLTATVAGGHVHSYLLILAF